MTYKVSTQKILDYAREKLPIPSDVKQRYATVLVCSFIGEPDFVDRYSLIELPNGKDLLIDKLEKDGIFEVAYSKTGLASKKQGWEFLWIREVGEIIHEELNYKII